MADKKIEAPNQTIFDICCDAFYEALLDYGYEYSDEDANEVFTPALQAFRDELKELMGNEDYYAKFTPTDKKSVRTINNNGSEKQEPIKK